MYRSDFILRLDLILSLILLLPSMGYTQQTSISEFTIEPGPTYKKLYLVDKFVFLACKMKDFDPVVMTVGWKFNGVTFAEAGERSVDGDEDPPPTPLRLRSNVNDVFGFDVDSDLDTYHSLTLDPQTEDYTASLDIFVSYWEYSGDYQCVICTKNGNGRCQTPALVESDITLDVAYFPPTPYPIVEISLVQNGIGVAVLGAETTVSCYTYSGNPEVDFSLLKGDEPVQGSKTESGEFLFYNYTFTPTVDDNGVIFTCTINNAFPGEDLIEENFLRTNSLSAIKVGSIPEVEIEGPSASEYGEDLVLTCTVTSATNTPVIDYTWVVSAGLSPSRYSENTNTLTVHAVEEGDSGVVVSCQVTDSDGMEGSESYTISAMHITTPKPSVSLPTGDQGSVAVIVVVVVVGLVLLILVISAFFWRRRKNLKQPQSGFENKPTAISSDQKKEFPDPKGKNGPYTISGNVSSSPKPDVIPGYYSDRGYPNEIEDYKNYSPYERSTSQEPFYPGDAKHPSEYHYNSGYGLDNEKQGSPFGYDDKVEVGDFTQASDRQPAYGQGYDDYNDDGDNDQRYPQEYDDYKPRVPGGYGDEVPVGYGNGDPPVGYGNGDPLGYDNGDPPVGYGNGDPLGYDNGDPPMGYVNGDPLGYDNGNPLGYDDGYAQGADQYDGGSLRSPHDHDNRDEFYPPEDRHPPPHDGYGDPNIPYDVHPDDRDGMYPKDNVNDPYDYEPYGERDQVPDGQEADFQGDPYHPPANEVPDGGSPTVDPYYGYDIDPHAGDSEKFHEDSLTSDRFDPSYV